MSLDIKKIETVSEALKNIEAFINTKYYEVEDFTLCIMLSMLSRTNMIALGQPGIAKSAILREIVELIEFDERFGTPYFHIQMGSDISPNNVFGAPDIHYFKTHGIIKRHFKGFLPDAAIAFCSEFYRVNDQVANSGLLTILNEGEFKNGIDTIKTNLRFFMADTNFFPKQSDDLDAEETDLKLQALHDRFLSRVYVKPLSDISNKIKMILMDDSYSLNSRLKISDLIYIQDNLNKIEISEHIASQMVFLSISLEERYNIFISPRRLKLSRNLVRASAVLNNRCYCTLDDLMALQFSFWQKTEDILLVKDALYEILDKPRKDAEKFLKLLDSVIDELDLNIENQRDFASFDINALYSQALKDITFLIEQVFAEYKAPEDFEEINTALQKINNAYHRLMNEQNELL